MTEAMIALLALAASVSAPLTAQPAPIADAVVAPAAEPIADAMSEAFDAANDRAMRMTIEASINGAGPFPFTIDTGSDRSVVSDRLAKALALPAGRTVIVHGIIGPQIVATVKVDRLTVGKRERRGISAPVLSERALGATGLLGVDALSDQAVVLDFKHMQIRMTRSDEDRQDEGTIIVTGRSRFGQLILTDARIGSKKVYAIIDTGAQGSVGNLELRQLLLGSRELHPNNSLLGVTGSEIPAEDGIIARIRLGGLSVTNMPIAFADAHTFRKFGVDDVPAILVGMDMLRRFDRVAVDFRRRQVRFLVGDGGATMAVRAAPSEKRIAAAEAVTLAP